MALGTRRSGEAEDGGRVQDHRHPMRHQRSAHHVALRLEVAHHARDRIGHPVRQVHARVAEADPRVRGGQEHHATGFVVVGVLARPHEVAPDHL